MLAAELRGMKPYLVDRVVVPEMEIVSAALQLLELLGVAFRLAELRPFGLHVPALCRIFQCDEAMPRHHPPLYRPAAKLSSFRGFSFCGFIRSPLLGILRRNDMAAKPCRYWLPHFGSMY